jgi:isoleucyl-tRNA synthetase
VLDEKLKADGDVNDLLRLVQQARKEAGLQVSDRIDVTLEVSEELWAAVQARVEKVKAETLALIVIRGEAGEDRPGVVAGVVGGAKVRVAVVKAGG